MPRWTLKMCKKYNRIFNWPFRQPTVNACQRSFYLDGLLSTIARLQFPLPASENFPTNQICHTISAFLVSY
jgi:hypothetical protein